VRAFVLVDLAQQADLLPLEVRTWARERILSWLSLFGQIFPFQLHISPDHTIAAWLFKAPSGLETTFVLTEDGRFYILWPLPRQVWGLPTPLADVSG
jgi:hypothetical protein